MHMTCALACLPLAGMAGMAARSYHQALLDTDIVRALPSLCAGPLAGHALLLVMGLASSSASHISHGLRYRLHLARHAWQLVFHLRLAQMSQPCILCCHWQCQLISCMHTHTHSMQQHEQARMATCALSLTLSLCNICLLLACRQQGVVQALMALLSQSPPHTPISHAAPAPAAWPGSVHGTPTHQAAAAAAMHASHAVPSLCAALYSLLCLARCSPACKVDMIASELPALLMHRLKTQHASQGYASRLGPAASLAPAEEAALAGELLGVLAGHDEAAGAVQRRLAPPASVCAWASEVLSPHAAYMPAAAHDGPGSLAAAAASMQPHATPYASLSVADASGPSPSGPSQRAGLGSMAAAAQVPPTQRAPSAPGLADGDGDGGGVALSGAAVHSARGLGGSDTNGSSGPVLFQGT